ncbi:protein-L-isoaspartate(D-aspartate) O-methyltransferase [bacterium]|nr:protein-L-isoaspartate(D-aspartate) O-methyltransferase [bacterium]
MNPVKRISVAIFGIFIMVSWIIGDIGWSETQQQKADNKYEAARLKMVEQQIKNRGTNSKNVLKAMRTVPRHEFVPQNLIYQAYADHPVPIGYNQTISQPYIVAYMTELLNVQENDKVLEVGTGSGYQAAVLAEIVDQVYTIEIIPELGEQAKERLKRLEYKNIEVKIEDGYNGWTEYEPYDAIIVTAAAEHIPPPLVKQLKPGGKMCIPVGSPFFVQDLTIVEKKKDGKIVTRKVLPVRFVPLVRKKTKQIPEETKQKTFKDFLDRKVTINYPPKRIISIAPSITEILFAIGLDEEIVGVTEYCDYPPKAKEKTKVGGYYTPSFEVIVSLKPDLVVAAADGPNEAHIDKLNKLDVPCFVVKPRTVDEIIESMNTLVEVTGKETTGTRTIDELKDRIGQVDKCVKSIPIKKRLKVFYALDHTDLYTTGKNTFVNDLIVRAGGINIAGGSDGWFKYSLESLVLKKPDVIITGKTEKQKHEEIVAMWQKYKMLPAVTDNLIYTIDINWLSRPGPRAIDALEKMVEFLYGKKE